MEFREAISRELLAHCRKQGLTLGRLAEISNVPLSTLKNIIAGQSRNPGILTLRALCNGLGITLADFISRAETFASPRTSGKTPQYNRESAEKE